MTLHDTPSFAQRDNDAASLLTPSKGYKPFRYPWAYELWHKQQQMHWLPDEVALTDDVRDWRTNLTPSEKHLLTQIFRFFTQADVDVGGCYIDHYTRVFKPVEVRMMLSAFSAMESVHMAAYSYLLDTVGMPETEYEAFLSYKEMRDKHDYMSRFGADDAEGFALTLAVFGAFTEGLQLFASFAMLMNFPRLNKMKGMGQIITWSVRDETLHTHAIILLFKTFVDENPTINKIELHRRITEACETIVGHEDAFIDLAFSLGEIKGMTAVEVKQYVRYIGDLRLTQLGLPARYGVTRNPLPWMDEVLGGMEHANFFEIRPTAYGKGTKNDWTDVRW
jgi:ribonucleoside-diphosphate reductase beta chain